MVPIPLHDHIRRQTFWLCTLLLIIANILTFIFEIALGHDVDRLVFYFGVIPIRYTNPHLVAEAGIPGLLVPIFTSMFLHGGWLHMVGNMLFLFVFGRSIEDRFGHVKFLLLYFLGGLGGALLHIFLNAGSHTPTIGASGAIAGVLGAYFLSYPTARITTLFPIFFFFWTVEIPALLLLGYWFVIQFLTGFEMQAIETATRGGIAWWAHVGGFMIGLILAATLRPRRRRVVEVLS